MGEPIFERLMACLSRLPGVGRRSAERMALKLVRDRETLLRELVGVLNEASQQLRGCACCGSITSIDQDPCRLCTDPTRDADLLCVVEDPNDIPMIERSGAFRGRYHALMGKLSPMRGEGPRNIRLQSLLARIDEEKVREVLLALNTDVESDATASYIAELLKDRKIKVTRLAFGLPAGSGIMYSDAVTLARAIRGRTLES